MASVLLYFHCEKQYEFKSIKRRRHMRFDLDKAFGIHQHGMLLRAKRAELLANNIANADTPNFKARDIDFKQAINWVE